MATQGLKRDAAFVRPARTGAMLTVLIALLVLSLLGPMMSYSELPMAGEGSPVRQGLYLLTFAVAVYGVRPVEGWRRLLVVPTTIVIALAWCWISIAWSIEPGIAVRRLLLTCLIIWAMFISVNQLGHERSVAILRIALAIALVANFLAVFAAPEFGIHQIAEPGDRRLIGDWRGILMHKNFAGAVCAVTIVAFAFDAKRIPMVLRVATIGAAAVFLYFSGSKTSSGLVVPAIAAGLLFQGYNARYRRLAISALCVAAVAAAATFALYRNPFSLDFGDKDAFTGRTQIWAALMDYSGDHGVLGAGYGSFWNIGTSSPIYHYASGWVTDVASGHNGFIDLLVTIGVPGLILALIAVFVAPLIRLLNATSITPARGALVIGLLLFCVGHNATESSLFDRDTIVQVVLMFAIALLRPLSAPKGRSGGLDDLFQRTRPGSRTA